MLSEKIARDVSSRVVFKFRWEMETLCKLGNIAHTIRVQFSKSAPYRLSSWIQNFSAICEFILQISLLFQFQAT